MSAMASGGAVDGAAGLRLIGYGDRWTVQQGDRVAFHVTCDGPAAYRAELVRLIHGDTHPSGPGFKEVRIACAADGEYPGRRQVIHSGSYGLVADRRPLRVESFTLQCWIWATPLALPLLDVGVALADRLREQPTDRVSTRPGTAEVLSPRGGR